MRRNAGRAPSAAGRRAPLGGVRFFAAVHAENTLLSYETSTMVDERLNGSRSMFGIWGDHPHLEGSEVTIQWDENQPLAIGGQSIERSHVRDAVSEAIGDH